MEPSLTPEYLKQILENINQKTEEEHVVNANYELANEHIPESLAPISMLYILGSINDIPVKMFVDTGAQVSIINESKIKELGIEHLVDKKCKGVVKGVGESESRGRIHYLEVTFGNYQVPFGVTVLEKINLDDCDMLLGLDTLLSNGATIDLRNRKLNFGGFDVDFI